MYVYCKWLYDVITKHKTVEFFFIPRKLKLESPSHRYHGVWKCNKTLKIILQFLKLTRLFLMWCERWKDRQSLPRSVIIHASYVYQGNIWAGTFQNILEMRGRRWSVFIKTNLAPPTPHLPSEVVRVTLECSRMSQNILLISVRESMTVKLTVSRNCKHWSVSQYCDAMQNDLDPNKNN